MQEKNKETLTVCASILLKNHFLMKYLAIFWVMPSRKKYLFFFSQHKYEFLFKLKSSLQLKSWRYTIFELFRNITYKGKLAFQPHHRCLKLCHARAKHLKHRLCVCLGNVYVQVYTSSEIMCTDTESGCDPSTCWLYWCMFNQRDIQTFTGLHRHSARESGNVGSRLVRAIYCHRF